MNDKNNSRNDKRVLDSGGLEEGSSVIDYNNHQLLIQIKEQNRKHTDEVDTSELLPSLQHDTSPGAESITVLVIPEAIKIRPRSMRLFNLECFGHFITLVDDFWRIGRLSKQSAHRNAGFFDAAFQEEVTGAFWKEHLSREGRIWG